MTTGGIRMTKRSGAFILGGLLVALLLAGVVSNFASAHPDGLDSSLRKGCTFDPDDNITGGSCPAQEAKEHELADSPLADYGVRGIENPYLSTGLSGVLGVLITFAIGGGVFWLARRRAAGGSGDRGATAATTGASAPGPRVGNASAATATAGAGQPAADDTE